MIGILSNLFASYTVQLCTFSVMCFFIGYYAPAGRVVRALVVAGCVVSIILVAASAFDLGETYRYSTWYKRNFFLFGDEISTALVAALFASIRLGRLRPISLISAGLLITGGKAAFLMAVGGMCLLAWAHRGYLRPRLLLLAMSIAIGLYGIANGVSLATPTSFRDGIMRTLAGQLSPEPAGAITSTATPLGAPPSTLAPAEGTSPVDVIAPPIAYSKLDQVQNVRTVCQTLRQCAATQVGNTFADRGLGIAAGLWMTLQGGFGGPSYPATAEAFARMMMAANPFGVNQRFGLNRYDWERVGRPENVLVNIGSSYGLWGLGLVLWVFIWLTLISMAVLRDREALDYHALAAFVIVMTVINQFQAFVMPWHYVFGIFIIAAAVVVRTSLEAALDGLTRNPATRTHSSRP